MLCQRSLEFHLQSEVETQKTLAKWSHPFLSSHLMKIMRIYLSHKILITWITILIVNNNINILFIIFLKCKNKIIKLCGTFYVMNLVNIWFNMLCLKEWYGLYMNGYDECLRISFQYHHSHVHTWVSSATLLIWYWYIQCEYS